MVPHFDSMELQMDLVDSVRVAPLSGSPYHCGASLQSFLCGKISCRISCSLDRNENLVVRDANLQVLPILRENRSYL